MLLAALICMFVATALLALGVCFSKKNKTLFFLLQTLSLVALVCLGMVAANYKNNFSGYAVLIILAVIPQFISLFDLSEFLKTKTTKVNQDLEALNVNENIENLETTDLIENDSKSRKKSKNKVSKHYFLNSNGLILKSVANFMTATSLALAGLYIGMETYLGFLIGVALALVLTFLLLIIKKKVNPYDLLSFFLAFLSIGLVLGQVVTILMFSFSLINILFSAGAIVFCVYAMLSMFVKSNFDHLAFFVAFFCLICTFII